MPIPVGSCEVWFAYQLTGDNEAMFTHIAYDMVDAPDQASVDAGFTAYQTAWKPLTAPQFSLIGGHVLVGNDGGSVRWDSSISPVVGTGSSAAVPQNTSYLIKKSTDSGGRRNRGRMYIPGVPSGALTGAGVLTNATVTSLNTAATTLKVGGTVHTAFGFLGQAQVLHESGSLTPTEITDLTASNMVATQRRRLRR